MTLRQPGAADIDPDAVDALPLRFGDVPLEVVANHPCVTGRDVQRLERSFVDARIGFAEPDFTFDEDRVERSARAESIDLAPLHLGAAIGQQRQPTSARPQPLDGVDRIVERLKPGIAQLVIGIADLSGQRLIVQAEHLSARCERPHDAPPPGRAVPRDGVRDRPNTTRAHARWRRTPDGIERSPIRIVRAAGLEPAGGDAPAVVQDRVVEIEENGSRKLVKTTSLHFLTGQRHPPLEVTEAMTAEEQRLEETRERRNNWKRWGPYLSERAWGTVREDYSPDGNAWEYFPHDQARSRAYRWNEDGIAGICDRHQSICFAIALWNEQDPILKERLFGLTGNEGNHGEDVKECYFYLDTTPTHSYMKFLYKYPQRAFPYAATRRREPSSHVGRSRSSSWSTRACLPTIATSTSSSSTPRPSSNDILIRITAVNRAERRRAAPSAARQSGFATRGRGDAGRRARTCSESRATRRAVALTSRRAGPLHAALRGRARAALHRERDEPPAALRHRQRAHPS